MAMKGRADQCDGLKVRRSHRLLQPGAEGCRPATWPAAVIVAPILGGLGAASDQTCKVVLLRRNLPISGEH